MDYTEANKLPEGYRPEGMVEYDKDLLAYENAKSQLPEQPNKDILSERLREDFTLKHGAYADSSLCRAEDRGIHHGELSRLMNRKMSQRVRSFFTYERYQARVNVPMRPDALIRGVKEGESPKQHAIGKQRLVAIGSIFGMFIGMGVASLGAAQMAGAGLAANTMEKKTNPRAEWADALSWGEGSILYLNFVK